MTERVLRSTASRALADEWVLALAADAIAVRIEARSGEHLVCVFEEDVARAEAILRSLDLEHEASRLRAQRVLPPAYDATTSLWAPIVMSSVLLLCWVVSGPRDARSAFFAQGDADGVRIRAGELWRCATALVLHADLPHLLGNTLFGSLFVHGLARSTGPGVALLLTLASGIAGNFLGALLRGGEVHSVGASTAVFGAIGALVGGAFVRRAQRRDPPRRRAAPLAAGLALLALIGTAGDRTDIWAHAFGLLSGSALGAALAVVRREPAGPLAQLASAIAAALSLGLAWWFALR